MTVRTVPPDDVVSPASAKAAITAGIVNSGRVGDCIDSCQSPWRYAVDALLHALHTIAGRGIDAAKPLMRSSSLTAFALAITWFSGTAYAADVLRVDIELAIAVDVSLSMDADEQDLQREGYAKAFRSPEVIQAISQGPRGRIAVMFFEWAGPQFHSVIVPWTIIASRPDAEALADRIAAAPFVRESGTSISSGLFFAAGRFAESGARGDRRTIDVSGDGVNNMGLPVETTRDWVVRQGITINGLPIMLKPEDLSRYDIPELDKYYEDCVIGGPGAFMITVDALDKLEIATRRKLVLEISGAAPRVMAASDQPTAERRVDCRAGEKARGISLPHQP